ncbi:MAG: hypothetical protein GX220_06950 [Treponema sp.]|nr:hypothetical protein [Treponema sp.]
MTTQVHSFNAHSYSNYVSGGMGKVYVPVKPSNVIYAQFEHVSGIAQNNEGGISINKINILNTLIDQLIKIKTDVTKPQLSSDLTNSQIDALIDDYQNQISNAINAANMTPFGLTGIGPEPGMILDIAA